MEMPVAADADARCLGSVLLKSPGDPLDFLLGAVVAVHQLDDGESQEAINLSPSQALDEFG